MSTRSIAIVMAVCGGLYSASPGRALVLDDLMAPSRIENPAVSIELRTQGAGIVGGERALRAFGATTLVYDVADASGSMLTAPGELLLSSPFADFVEIAYAGSDGLGLGGIDLTDDGRADRFLFGVAEATGLFIFNLTIESGGSSASVPLIIQSATPPGAEIEIGFDAFPTSVDLTAVDAISFSTSALTGTVRFDAIATVPEPTGGLEVGAILLALLAGGRSRARRRASLEGPPKLE